MRPSPRRWSVLAVAVTAVGVVAAAQQPPTFRAEIDSVQLDIRVVDEDGRFVRDLGRGDLQIREDGQQVRAESSAAPGRPVVRQIPIAIR